MREAGTERTQGVAVVEHLTYPGAVHSVNQPILSNLYFIPGWISIPSAVSGSQ